MYFKELIKIMEFIQKETQLEDLYIICQDKWDWNICSDSQGIIMSWDSDTIETFEDFKKYYNTIDK
jgi:hypothetical protein